MFCCFCILYKHIELWRTTPSVSFRVYMSCGGLHKGASVSTWAVEDYQVWASGSTWAVEDYQVWASGSTWAVEDYQVWASGSTWAVEDYQVWASDMSCGGLHQGWASGSTWAVEDYTKVLQCLHELWRTTKCGLQGLHELWRTTPRVSFRVYMSCGRPHQVSASGSTWAVEDYQVWASGSTWAVEDYQVWASDMSCGGLHQVWASGSIWAVEDLTKCELQGLHELWRTTPSVSFMLYMSCGGLHQVWASDMNCGGPH